MRAVVALDYVETINLVFCLASVKPDITKSAIGYLGEIFRVVKYYIKSYIKSPRKVI